jgi:SAM-dependent methyltransferase
MASPRAWSGVRPSGGRPARSLERHRPGRRAAEYPARHAAAGEARVTSSSRADPRARGFLLDFHAHHPGATARAFARGRSGDGRSSYEILADAARPGERVLDLGCGDGFLLELLVARGHAPAALRGIDLSPHELAAARRRPALAGVALVCEPAQSLSAGDGELDCALSHLAFTLMDDLEQVMAELARALRPGGTFATVVGGGPAPGDAFELFLDLLAPIYADLAERAPRLGDPRARDAVGLAPLAAAAGFEPIEETALTVRFDGAAAEVWDTLATIYEMAVVPPGAAADLRASFLAEAGRLADTAGSVPCSIRVRCLRARRSG